MISVPLKRSTKPSSAPELFIARSAAIIAYSAGDIVKIPIAADAGFEEDTETERTLLFNDISERKEIALRLSADRRAEFGEVFRFLLVPGSI